ncbi:hypothetical protein HNI00_17200 [Thermoleptolyngbya oregonensis NK1-22]|uniref:Uncharacterized protein n=1 Tax=Thermoleptolyngbya oregonensis NK1-22 TaxID=2547457 RepID=A0AA96YQS7_9CYAN|nr:hypothetical protein [Thermoleptolyngbya oregonensis]WOB44692.1 hypothetical protein HNI00_17200 [Thermoleptolyngbya oregonensis NK1-22]
MLTQIVRPMVRTQLRLLASSQSTRATLVNTIAQWLGFLGVEARVTEIDAASDKIQVSLVVGKPEACDSHDWEQILKNLEESERASGAEPTEPIVLTPQQQSKLQRLLAYVIQAGSPDSKVVWEDVLPQLRGLGYEEDMLLGIRSALKIPQSLEVLTEGLDADLAAIALPKAVSLSMLDRRVTASEDQALSALLEAMKQPL